MTSLPIGRKWKQPKNKFASRTRRNSVQWLTLIEDLMKAGLLLSLSLLVLAVLSGCSPTVVREPCPQYPLPPEQLMQPPLNESLVPASAKPSPTTPSKMPQK